MNTGSFDSTQVFDVVVAGGGLSGLAVAEAILRREPQTRVLCLEARERTGGCIRTIRRDGFVMEAGPAGFLDRSGAMRRLAVALGMEERLIVSDSGQPVRWVQRGGRLHRFPDSVGSFLRSDLLSARGKLRMLLEPFQPNHEGEETVDAFATRRLGWEAAQVLVDPIVSGIYAADAAQVSLQASLPELAAVASSNRSLLSRFLRSTGRVSPLISFRDGCEELVDKLRLRVLSNQHGSIRCDAPIEAVLGFDGRGTGFRVRVAGAHPQLIRCRVFVSAAPAIAASRFFSSLDARIAWQLAQVRYASVAVISLGYLREDVPHPLRGFGYLIPSCEESRVLGVQWSSSIYPGHRAPDGTCQLRLFLGGARHPTLARQAEGKLAAIAAAELSRTLGVRATPLACEVHRHLEAMPQYLLEHGKRVEDIERRSQQHPGLFIGGNGMRGLGMDSLVRDAELQADAVVQYLETSPRALLGASLHPGRAGSGSGPRVAFTGEGSPNP
ncbi:MAG: protoporphyrinogen oxidase [Myxococcales bacterium]|nr:protoporphyrinogen oxidase [Myxococcales bacterium]